MASLCHRVGGRLAPPPQPLGSWIPGVNRPGPHGRWPCAEFRDEWELESGLAGAITAAFSDLVAAAAGKVSP
jgi:hypothetical protein